MDCKCGDKQIYNKKSNLCRNCYERIRRQIWRKNNPEKNKESYRKNNHKIKIQRVIKRLKKYKENHPELKIKFNSLL